MSNLRAGPYALKDSDDDAAFQQLKADVTEILIALRNPSPTIQKAYLQATKNLSDVADVPTARANLGITSAFTPLYVNATSSNGSLANNTWTTITTLTAAGTLTGLNTTTGVFTVPTTGLYLIDGAAYVSTSGSGVGAQSWRTDLRLNCSSVSTNFTTTGIGEVNGSTGTEAGNNYLTLSRVIPLTVGDTISLQAYVFIGGTFGAGSFDLGVFNIARLS